MQLLNPEAAAEYRRCIKLDGVFAVRLSESWEGDA